MLLVVGNAATADGLVHAHEVPSAHEVGNLTAIAGGPGFWMPGGAASAIAIAAASHVPTRLAHPLPARGVSDSGDELRHCLGAVGVDFDLCPELERDVRALVVEVPEVGTRLMWSEPGASFEPNVDELLVGVSHVVFAPRWGAWSSAILAAAMDAAIPCSVIGEIPSVRHRWTFAIADHRQMKASNVAADTFVTTAGSRGADVVTTNRNFHIDALPTDVIDTTGAGDSFGGTFIGASMAGAALELAGSYAAAAAAAQCTRWGAIPSISPN